MIRFVHEFHTSANRIIFEAEMAQLALSIYPERINICHMKTIPVNRCPAWNALEKQADVMDQPENHLRFLVREKNRLSRFSLSGAGVFFDFSRQRLNSETLDLLGHLAEQRDLPSKFKAMVSGEKVNTTENRAALHTAMRSFSHQPVVVDGLDVMPEIQNVRNQISEFSKSIQNGDIKGSTGKPFKFVVVIGIGGSYLGTQFVSSALEALADKGFHLLFLSNVDVHNFGSVVSRIDPESTLWIIISKSYTTPETSANEHQAAEFMISKGLDPSKHLVTVTSKGSPGDDRSNPVLATFHMFDFVGGRYSVSSAVGGVPLSLYLGYERFEEFLKGAEEMDTHILAAPIRENLPIMAALISVWNNNFLGYETQAIIPYASPLSKLAPHVQQLNMESNGKLATKEGEIIDYPSGVIVFGEPGTNAQHSFFQLAHQGRPFPIDFIGVVNPQHDAYQAESKGVTNHQELWANLISQPMALAMGKDSDDKAKYFPGNRPSSTLLLENLTPRNIGRLLSFYEAKTVFEAFIWGVNPFDQFGVELGKTLASDIRAEMAEKNENPSHSFDSADPISRHYLEVLFSGKIK